MHFGNLHLEGHSMLGGDGYDVLKGTRTCYITNHLSSKQICTILVSISIANLQISRKPSTSSHLNFSVFPSDLFSKRLYKLLAISDIDPFRMKYQRQRGRCRRNARRFNAFMPCLLRQSLPTAESTVVFYSC